LEGRSLAEALRALLDDFQARTGVETGSLIVGAHQPLPVRLEVGVYRIAQEALANVEQHAGARLVELELVVTPESLEFTVVDDGHGFQPEAVQDERFGLVGINERVHLMGGHLDLRSMPEAGTHLKVSIPLKEINAPKK
jgi:signal transduction histidine kinase